MSLDLLGEGFDLHGGGQDLRFPHHENERAQAVALGKRFANHWMHHGFVVDAEGEKMSKSLGNFDNLLDLLERYDRRAYRMVLLQSHYRSPVQVGDDTSTQRANALAGLDAFAARAGVGPVDGRRRRRACSTRSGPRWTTTSTRPKAMALLFDTVRRANAALDAGDRRGRPLVAAVARDRRRGRSRARSPTVEVPADAAAARPRARRRSRAAKDYATADAIRARAARPTGWIVETTRRPARRCGR